MALARRENEAEKRVARSLEKQPKLLKNRK